MAKNQKTTKPTMGFTRSDVELALHQWATKAQAAKLEKMDVSSVPKPDPQRFERLIQKRLHA